MDKGIKWRFPMLIFMALLGMALMRMIWLQIRTYQPEMGLSYYLTINHLANFTGRTCDLPTFLPAPTPRGQEPGESTLLEAHSQFDSGKEAINLNRPTTLISPGLTTLASFHCREQLFDPMEGIRTNLWAFGATFFFAALLMRFVTSSWMISLIATVTLLSRGSLAAELASLSSEHIIMMCLMLWITCVAHYLRTGSLKTYALSGVCVLIAALFEPPCAMLIFAVPLFILFSRITRRRLLKPFLLRLKMERSLKRKRQREAKLFGMDDENSGYDRESWGGRIIGGIRQIFGLEFSGSMSETWHLDSRRGTLLRSIDLPFILWISSPRNRWKKFFLMGLVQGAFIILIVFISFNLLWSMENDLSYNITSSLNLFPKKVPIADFLKEWGAMQLGSVDLHLSISLVILFASLVIAPAKGLTSFFECIVILFMGMVLVIMQSCWLDYAEFVNTNDVSQAVTLFNGRGPFFRQALFWFEPIVLCLGIAGIFNMLRVVDISISRHGR